MLACQVMRLERFKMKSYACRGIIACRMGNNQKFTKLTFFVQTKHIVGASQKLRVKTKPL